MNLSTNYMNLKLQNPIIAGASPLSHSVDSVRALEQAGVAAVVMHSLFEEQLVGRQVADFYYAQCFTDAREEIAQYFPERNEFVLDADTYLRHVAKLKKAVKVPVITSLNACTPRAWSRYATQLENAGADALELNIYFVAANPRQTSRDIENNVLEIVRSVAEATKIPVAVKLPPYFTGLSNFAAQVADMGAQGLVIFNRFYEPDVNLETMEARAEARLSNPSELLLRLHWAAILSPQLNIDIAVAGGVHAATDAIKAISVGAAAVQVVSAFLEHGPEYAAEMLAGLEKWMRAGSYHSLRSLRGLLSLNLCPDPQAFERGAYLRTLLGWKETKGKTPAGVS